MITAREFIKFLCGLPEEGETVLIVKQKDTGEFHNDKSVKYVWPAMMPSRYREDGGAWYANTASFIIDRLLERVSAAAGNATHCICLLLDDVGTKSKKHPLKPTWIIETSPGNYQYGYVLRIQPTTGQFSAAIVALAAAGYTDGGAINPVRNFRIPGSVNLKPEHGGFAAKMVEFNPDLEYTLEEICAAVNVVPAEANTAAIRKLQLVDDGKDDVLAWLKERGDLMEARNPEGWYGVTCPNAVEHSDGNLMGRYMPVNRAYSCFHEHCGDWNSRRFLDWVAENGGPQHEHGLRDTLLAETMAAALSKITPGNLFNDDAKSIVADVERREMGRMEKNEWFERFAYVESEDGYFDMQTRRYLSRSTFNALYRHIGCLSVHNNRKIEASVSYDENRQTMGAPSVAGITYAAGEPVLILREGETYVNRWRNCRPAVTPGNVQRWLDHCAHLIPDSREMEHCLSVMAFRVQHPDIKINHAVLHGGIQGSGKDTMWSPMIYGVGGASAQNRGLMDNDSVSSQWGYQLESEILVINELREPEAAQRRAFANKLKPIIAAPPDYLPINRKGLHPYMMLNRIFVLAFSNDYSPISLDTQDRRWFCTWSAAPRMADEDSASMWDWFNKGGMSACAAYLHSRDVSKFNPKATPPETEYKQNLIETGMSTAESILVEMMRNRKTEFAAGVIASPFHILCNRLLNEMPPGIKIPQSALLHALQEAKWVDMGRLQSGDFTTKKHIFCAPDLRHYRKSDLRRMVEEPSITGNVVAIKKPATGAG